MENLSVGRSASRSGSVSVLSGTQRLAQETNGKPKIERVAHQQIQMPALPIPDYETLFPKKRHGVMGQTRWDHIIAEVNQRRMDRAPKCSGSEMSADSHDESKVTCQPLVPYQTTLAQQKSLGEGSGKTTGPSTQKVLQRPKPILSDEKFDVRPKQALQPPRPVIRDKVVCPNTKQTPQPLKPVSPRQTVAVPTMTDNASASPSGEKPLKVPNYLLFSALENVQKRNIRYTKPQEYAGNEKAALGTVSEPCHPWVTPATEVPDTNTAGVIKTPSNTQEELCVNSRPTIPTRKPKKEVRNQQSECAPATLKEMVSNSDHQSSKNHSENTAGSDGIQKMFEEDPFPTNQLFSHDPWQLPQESTNDEIFLMKDPILNDCLTMCPKQNKSEEIISLPPQVTKKKRQAPLPPVTSTSLSIEAKQDKRRKESCEELRSDVKIKEYMSRSVLEKSGSSVNNEQRNAEDLGISSAAFNKTVFAESSSKQQLIKPKHSPASSAEKLPQATSGILKLALENAQKRNTDVNKTVVTKSADMDEQAGSAEKTSKVVTPTPQITPKKRRAPHPPGPSSSFSSKAKPDSEIEAKDDILTKNSCSSIHNDEQRKAENKDMPTDTVVTCTKTATFPETSSKQKVEVEQSQTSQSQHKEPEGTKQDDVSQSVIKPTTEALEEDRPKESIEVQQMQNVSEAAEVQKDTTLKLDPFANSEIPLKDPWKIPEQAKTDDCQVTDEGKTKNTKFDNGCLTPDDFDNIVVSNVPADTFSDSSSQKFSEKDKNVTIIDGCVPVPQILLKETLPPVSSSSIGNSGLSSDEQASEPDISPDAVLFKATVIITPSEKPVMTEPLDTSTAFQREKAKEVSTLHHKKGVTQVTEKMQKEIEVIPMNDDQHATLCQMASLEKVPDVDTENMIECDPSRDVLLSSDSRNFLQLNKHDDDLAHNTQEDVITEETGLFQHELNRNRHSDIPTDLLSTSSCIYAALSCERKTVEVIPDINVSPAILSNQDSLHHEGLSTNAESKPGTQEISSIASKQDADPWKEESLSSAITTTSVKDTLTNLSHTQQDRTSSISRKTLICPSVDHLSPMSSEITESVSNTNIQENSAGPVSHLVKLKSSFNTLQTLHSYESDYVSGRQELWDANTSGKSPSAPTMLTSDAPWERDSDESLICTSAGQVTEDSQSDFARSPQQNTQENYILRTISQSAQVPALNISSTSKGSSSAPEPENWRSTLPQEAFLHPILEEDIPVVRAKENQWGENHFPTSFFSKSTFQSMSTKETGRAEQFGHFSPMSAGPKYARISPLEVQAVLPDDIGPPLASSPLR